MALEQICEGDFSYHEQLSWHLQLISFKPLSEVQVVLVILVTTGINLKLKFLTVLSQKACMDANRPHQLPLSANLQWH